ncbi:hypothetical protein NliqN6_4611 [Naganishia liquefaciens]|uniref:Pre-mRNA-splicing factor SPF27 n=1 Tax=Naganishia liquefaciens TaxID=104408 RepID=A0A8H3YG12_9TREE|nr:hypothetical protein NliqN6_4611 [Naganishia liquefaciens]
MDTLIDALPYVDKEIEQLPGLKDAVLKEIQREMKSTPKVAADDARLPPKADIFSNSPNLSTLLQGYPSQTLTTTKAVDPSQWQVPHIQPSTNATPDEWTTAERKTRIALAHMDVRNTNAQLQATYAPNAWLIRNYQLEGEAKEIEHEVVQWTERVTEVNRARRVFQEDKGKHLAALETRWQDLVTGTVQLELANVALQGEVDALERKAAALEKELNERV